MRVLIQSLVGALLLVVCATVGCEGKPATGPVASTPSEHAADQAAINESLAQLSSDDRILAESQKFCAIATSNPLGTMGTPVKIDVNGEPVFLCCAGCKTKALGNPEETLASVAKLKADNSLSK